MRLFARTIDELPKQYSDNGERILFEGRCNEGTLHKVIVRTEDFKKYNLGTCIQDAFPYISPTQREFLMTGMCCHPMWTE